MTPKFKFFDKEKKEFVREGYDDYLFVSKYGAVCCVDAVNHDIHEPDNIIAIPYTGCHDSEGNPIYLHDIVNFFSYARKHDGTFYHIESIRKVEFYEGAYGIMDEEYMSLFEFGVDRLKILGSSLTNPELLAKLTDE